jgi:RNA polymerase sigma-70 factor (ECF subfamily)
VPEAALCTEPVGPARFLSAERRAALRRAIDELAPKQRMVVELRIYDELSFREVAELARCSVNAAKVSFHHALGRLRAILQEDDE